MLSKMIMKLMKDVDVDALQGLAVKMQQDAAYGTYNYNIYMSGVLDGYYARSNLLRSKNV